MPKIKQNQTKQATCVKLSKQGQLTIPKQILKDLGIELDSVLDLELKNNHIIIKKRINPIDRFNGILKGTITLDEYLKIRKEEAKL